MDSQAAAAGPWIALGVAAAALLAVLGTAAVLVLRAGRGPADPAPGDGGSAGGGFGDDDLPGFRERPPGHPGAHGATAHSAGPVPLTAGALAPPPPATRSGSARATARLSPTTVSLLIMATAAMLLVLAAAGVGLATRA